jgi:hypothetical protein
MCKKLVRLVIALSPLVDRFVLRNEQEVCLGSTGQEIKALTLLRHMAA